MLLIFTGSGVSKTAQIICKASFLAPCGMISPLSCFPPCMINVPIPSVFSSPKDFKKLGAFKKERKNLSTS